MTNREVLKKAISRAIDGGWKYGEDTTYNVNFSRVSRVDGILSVKYELYIFTHDFAKALWGEDIYNSKVDSGDSYNGTLIWQYHLQQMVISSDPIKYLGENI